MKLMKVQKQADNKCFHFVYFIKVFCRSSKENFVLLHVTEFGSGKTVLAVPERGYNGIIVGILT